MRSFGITLKNELLRMTRRKKLLAGIIISAIIPILIVLANAPSLVRNITLIYREDLIRTALSLFTPMILPLLAIVLVADAFIDEQSKGSLKTTLLLPDTRNRHFTAKVISSFIGTSAMILTLWVFSIVSGLALPSRGGWLLSIGMGLLQSVASLLPIIMVTGFSVLVSQFIKSGSGMVFTLMGLSLLLKLLPLWVGDFSGILPTTWLGFGVNVGNLSITSILYALAVMLFWTVVSGGIAIIRFERKVM